ncbi:hypothetical protein L227DRAFT_580531 [Lentinus tigrinus ALCF2SS1-6]|uniref:Homeobox domain-containing protein n=1 Tax=Lentinus tigrinus ALCF2SS1-6 TaxID=1328759 RepID=A0A5C2RT70_9APHY|nr:hypothetical protein L227DRAFT_580531 [Lentinus tigrinus ALCF2SS1-6]
MNDFQNSFLEDYLRRNDHPNGPQRDWIASQLDLSTEAIHNWFRSTGKRKYKANNPS